MSDPRMSADELETVIEEIATTVRHHGSDERGLHTIRLQMVRPDGRRTYVDYTPEADPSSQPKAGT